MATKKPIVLTAGQREQIQATDVIDPTTLATGTLTNGFVPTVQSGALVYQAASGGMTIGKSIAQQRGFFCQ